MDKQEFDAINKHIEEIENSETTAIYPMAVKAALLEAEKRPSKDMVLDENRYIFTPVRKPGTTEALSAKLMPAKEGNIFYILGIMEIINRKTDESKTVYACMDFFQTAAIIFWVDDHGRINNDEDEAEYSYVLSNMCPDLHIQTSPRKKKNSTQQAQAETLFHQMEEKLKKLQQSIGHDRKVLEIYEELEKIGNQILEDYPDFIYRSGTYTTLASAAFGMYQNEALTTPESKYLIQAKEYAEKAIEEDHRNQNALGIGVTTNLFAMDIRNARKYLSEMRDSGFDSVIISTGCFGISTFTFILPSHEKKEESKQELFNFLHDLCEKGKKQEIPVFLYAPPCIQLIYAVYNDEQTAYRFISIYARELQDNPMLFDLYALCCMVCLHPSLKKTDEAAYYGKLGMKYVKNHDAEQQANITSFYGLALAYQGNHNGIGYCKRATQICPSDNTFYNCGQCLNLLGKAKDGIQWAQKALYLHEDDMNHLLLADLYQKTGQDALALEHYLKALQKAEKREYLSSFTDGNGKETMSVISDASLDHTLYNVFKNTISIYIKQQDYKSASIHLALAEELIPDHPDWEIYKKILPVIEITQKELSEARAELLSVKAEAEEQARVSRELVEKLMDLQDQFRKANMDKYNNWKPFEDEINKIIDQLEAEASKDQKRMENVKDKFTSKFSNYSPEAIHFLTTAEVLYELHKNNEIDFACIVVEYCKVLEHQLRRVMGDQIPESVKMLGGIIGLISDKKDSPYTKCLGQLNEVNELRKQSAHTGSLKKQEAERIRTIYFDEGLLDLLN